MKFFILLCSAVAVLLQWPSAQGAEDHPAHHEHPQPDSAPSVHSQHTMTPDAASNESELRHVAPPPPQRAMRDMTAREMVETMDMDDAASYGMLSLDRVEWNRNDGESVLSWEGHAWYGGDYDKLWLKFEGESAGGVRRGSNELLWDRNFSRWWSWQAGVRNDFAPGPSRTWVAAGVQGLAPYWFEVGATAYVGEAGRTAARFDAGYELLLTQRWILRPQAEINFYGKDDARNGLGSGLSDTELGMRLRYEIRREFAPYVGVVWSRQYGRTADLAKAAGHDDDELQWVLGVRAWF